MADRGRCQPRGRAALRYGDPIVNPRLAAVGALALGGLAVIAATAVGSDGATLDAIVRPPIAIRAVLAGVSAAVAVVLLSRGLIPEAARAKL